VTSLNRLVDHCTWANEQWITRLFQATPTESRLHQLMSHVLLSEQVWFQRVAGEPLDTDIWRPLKSDEMRDLHNRNTTIYRDLVDGDLRRDIEYTRFTGEHYCSPVSDIVLHLCLHGMHHRGQMARTASELKVARPNTDFINYCIVNRL
jgi:uncharacterized damage-inducible protein DinB